MVTHTRLKKENGCSVVKGEEIGVLRYTDLCSSVPVEQEERLCAPEAGELLLLSNPIGGDHRDVGIYLRVSEVPKNAVVAPVADLFSTTPPSPVPEG